MKEERIVLGGGCFWCMEAVFRQVPGVVDVEPGYAGGWVKHPTYEEVCTGKTGHAEVVHIRFHPEKISLHEILEIFFQAHDPTAVHRQGPDEGPQYRSVILYDTPEQWEEICRFLRQKMQEYSAPIVTEVKKLEAFYPAEPYHHRYFERNPENAYCRMVIAPKLQKLKQTGILKNDT